MKVDNNGPVRTNVARPGRTAPGNQGQFSAELSQGSRNPGVSGGAPIGGAAALMALQEVCDRGEGRRKAVRHGTRLLDLLDELRVGLLTGGLSSGTLNELSRLVGEAREQVDSPDLQQILDEIDLRAQVELAKHESLR